MTPIELHIPTPQGWMGATNDEILFTLELINPDVCVSSVCRANNGLALILKLDRRPEGTKRGYCPQRDRESLVSERDTLLRKRKKK